MSFSFLRAVAARAWDEEQLRHEEWNRRQLKQRRSQLAAIDVEQLRHELSRMRTGYTSWYEDQRRHAEWNSRQLERRRSQLALGESPGNNSQQAYMVLRFSRAGLERARRNE